MNVPRSLSIVVPTRNRHEQLAALCGRLDSLPLNVEVIVVDDASSLPVDKGVLANVPNGALVRLDGNRGASSARNVGLGIATGEFVVFLDDDDLPLAGWAEALMSGLADPSVAAVCLGARRRRPDGELDVNRTPERTGSLFGGLEISVLAGTFAVRTDVLRRVGGFNEALRYAELTELWIRIATLVRQERWTVLAVPDALIEIRLRPVSVGRHDHRDVLRSVEMILDEHKSCFESDRNAAASFHAVAGRCALRLSMRRRAASHLGRSLLRRPGDGRAWLRLAGVLVPVSVVDRISAHRAI